MKRFLAVFAFMALFHSAAHAGFDEGLLAAQAGNFEQALKEWTPLAEKGSKAAQANIARLYEKGAGVKQDYVQAAFWYRKSAAQGLANAQSSLGDLYANGLGVPQDFVMAYFLYSIAEVNGDPTTTNALEVLAASMTPKQLDEARGLASTWKTGDVLPIASKTWLGSVGSGVASKPLKP